MIPDAQTQSGQSLVGLSRASPVLVLFLRHGGCPFCRQTLAELAKRREKIEAAGTRLVLVHMMSEADAARLLASYDLADVQRISDPEQTLYRAFGLRRGKASQVMGPRIWWRGFKATVLRGHLPGRPKGDIFQLPGAYLLVDGEVVRRFEPETSAEQPDFVELARCELPSSQDARPA